MNKIEHTLYSLLSAELCIMCWVSTNFVAAHQYKATYDGTTVIWDETIRRCLDGYDFPYTLAFFVPSAVVVLLWSNAKARLVWLFIALGMALLPFLEWDDVSKEIIVDGCMLYINLIFLPLLAAAMFLVLLLRRDGNRSMSKQ